MKTKVLFFALTLILHFNLGASNQKMVDLYKYAIEDYYNESLKKEYLSKQDTMYLIWCFYDYSDNCIDYDIQLNNDKIQFKMPKVDHNYTSATVIRLSMPELKGQFIQVLITPYIVTYFSDEEGVGFINSGTVEYVFQYDKKKSKYTFKSKKEYGL
jgi:hypothetical protein